MISLNNQVFFGAVALVIACVAGSSITEEVIFESKLKFF